MGDFKRQDFSLEKSTDTRQGRIIHVGPSGRVLDRASFIERGDQPWRTQRAGRTSTTLRGAHFATLGELEAFTSPADFCP